MDTIGDGDDNSAIEAFWGRMQAEPLDHQAMDHPRKDELAVLVYGWFEGSTGGSSG
jgi:hypothetical protein